MPNHLIPPHGGRFVNLMADANALADLKRTSRHWHAWELTPRQLGDLELLMNGAYSPLRGFLSRKDYESVCERMRLYNEALWPIPIVLDVPEEVAARIEPGVPLALYDSTGVMLAYVDVGDKWKADRFAEAETVYGTTDRRHPGVRRLLEQTYPWYVGGRVVGLELPKHYDFLNLRLPPAEVRWQLIRRGWRKVAAFPASGPMHRSQYEATRRVIMEQEVNLLIHPAIGAAGPAGLEQDDRFARVRRYQAMLDHYPPNTAMLSLLPLAPRQAGAREVLWQAIIRKNYGCTHFIMESEQAEGDENGVFSQTGEEILALAERYREELGVILVPHRRMLYVEDLGGYLPAEEITAVQRAVVMTEAEACRRLAEGREIPPWFTFPELAEDLRRSRPPRSRQGFTLLFTGLPAAGKTTLARTLAVRLLEMGGRQVTLLDDEAIRTGLADDRDPFGEMSRDQQEAMLRRLSFVAGEITRNRGVAVCATVAPYDEARKKLRERISPLGGFSLIHVSTPRPVCESRDRRGLYTKAAPAYEPPGDADLVLDTSDLSPEEGAQQVLLHLQKTGYIAAD